MDLKDRIRQKLLEVGKTVSGALPDQQLSSLQSPSGVIAPSMEIFDPKQTAAQFGENLLYQNISDSKDRNATLGDIGEAVAPKIGVSSGLGHGIGTAASFVPTLINPKSAPTELKAVQESSKFGKTIVKDPRALDEIKLQGQTVWGTILDKAERKGVAKDIVKKAVFGGDQAAIDLLKKEAKIQGRDIQKVQEALSDVYGAESAIKSRVKSRLMGK